MSFHTGQTFTYGETPSATKMQYIWDNDYALADGTGIEDDAIIARHLADGAVLPEALVAGAGTDWAWQSHTPAFANFTLGNGSVAAKYSQIGKTVHYRGKVTLGSTSSVGSGPTFGLPVTAHAGITADCPLGEAWLLDSSTGNRYPATALWQNSTSLFFAFYNHSAGSYSFWGVAAATFPFTWATGDIISWNVTYEAA